MCLNHFFPYVFGIQLVCFISQTLTSSKTKSDKVISFQNRVTMEGFLDLPTMPEIGHSVPKVCSCLW